MSLLNKILAAVVSLILAAGAGFLSHAVRPIVETNQRIGADTLRQASEVIPISLLGQLRINLDDYLWLKTEDYLHFGLTRGFSSKREFQAKMIRDYQASVVGRSGKPSGSPGPRSAGRDDWRGFFRKLEFFHPIDGYHGNPLQLLPWYRMQTKLNPLDKQAYVSGAFFLVDLAKKPEEALAFLEEGLENNPRSPELHVAVGRFYFEKLERHDEAIPYLQKAVSFGREIQGRTEAEEEALENAYLFLAMAHRKQHDLDAALRVAKEGVVECRESVLIPVIYRVVMRDIGERQ
jgi:tetratricopeptide (TPR) repeat protein